MRAWSVGLAAREQETAAAPADESGARSVIQSLANLREKLKGRPLPQGKELRLTWVKGSVMLWL